MIYHAAGALILNASNNVAAIAATPTIAAKIVAALNAVPAPAPTPTPTPTPVPTPTPTPVPAPATAPLLGAYAGAANVAGVTAFEAAIGRHVDLAHEYLDERSWGSISDPTWYWQAWKQAGFSRLLLGVPLTIDGTSLADVAAGKHDAEFEACAKSLASAGFLWLCLRLGWEFNGGWYPWSQKSDPSNYLAAFERVARIFKAAVPGVLIEWCISCQSGQPVAHPDPSTWDVVGGDAYDMTWQGAGLTPAQRWQKITNSTDGLGWVASTAKALGKRVGVPEWGCSDVSADSGGGGGDDPIYIANMHQWLADNNALYSAYFPASDLVSKTPRALAQFKALWTS